MIEILIGMGAVIVVLILAVVHFIKTSATLRAEKKELEASLQIIHRAHDAIAEQITIEETQRESNENSISERNYFS